MPLARSGQLPPADEAGRVACQRPRVAGRPGLDLPRFGAADLGLLVLTPDEAGAVAAFQSIPLAHHGVFLTPENLHSGDYPPGRPRRVVFRRESAQALRPLLRFLFSDEFARLLERAGVIPLAPAARHQQSLAFEKP